MTGSSLLLNERPLYALPRLASFLGSMDDAVVLQQTFWLCQNPEYHRLVTHTDEDGKTWVLLTSDHARQLYFMWLKKDALKRINRRLLKEKLMSVRYDLNAKHNPDKRQHRAPWYTVDGEKVKALAEPIESVRALSKIRKRAATSKRGIKMHSLSDDSKGDQNAPPLGDQNAPSLGDQNAPSLGDQNAPPFSHLSTGLSTENQAGGEVVKATPGISLSTFEKWHQLLQRSADSVTYNTLFSPLYLVECEAPRIVLATPNKHHLDRLHGSLQLIAQTLEKMVGFVPDVEVIHRMQSLSTIVSSGYLRLTDPINLTLTVKKKDDDQEKPVPEPEVPVSAETNPPPTESVKSTEPTSTDLIQRELDSFGLTGQQVDHMIKQRPDLVRIPGYIYARHEQAQRDLKTGKVDRYTGGLLVYRLTNPHMYPIHPECRDCGLCDKCQGAWAELPQ